MKCQSLFSGKKMIKKNKMLSADFFLSSMLSVKHAGGGGGVVGGGERAGVTQKNFWRGCAALHTPLFI